MRKIKPCRIIDYLHRGKVKRFAVNVELSDGHIRLDYTDINVNRMYDFEWVKFDQNKLIREYHPEDEEYKNIIKIWWLMGRNYVKLIKKGKSLGTYHIRDIYKNYLKHVNTTPELLNPSNK